MSKGRNIKKDKSKPKRKSILERRKDKKEKKNRGY